MNVYFLASRYFGLEGVRISLECDLHCFVAHIGVAGKVVAREAAALRWIAELATSKALTVELEATRVLARAALEWLKSSHLF